MNYLFKMQYLLGFNMITNRYFGITKKLLYPAIALLSLPLAAQNKEPRLWKMKNGKTMNAIGINVNFSGMIAQAPKGDERAFIPYKNLDPLEVKYAAENLPINMGESEKFKLVARTISSTRNNYKVVTGYARTFPSVTNNSSGSGNSNTTSAGGIREITKRASTSSKLIELRMSSLCDGVATWVDFLVIGEGKTIVKHEKGVYYFKELGDIVLFDFPPTNNYMAWAFVFRSIETGEILGSQSSIQPLKDFAEATVKASSVSAKQKPDEIRKMLLKAVIKE